MRIRGKVMKKRLIGWFCVLCALVVAGTTIGCLYGYQRFVQLQSQERLLTFAEAVNVKIHQNKAQTLKVQATKERKAAQDKAEKARQAAEDARNQGSTDSSACNNSTTHNDPSQIDVLVNKKHCIQPLTYAPSDLRTSNGATLKQIASISYDSLIAAAKKDGLTIQATSSYRSYSDQVSTYNYWVGVSGRDGADTYSARPGYSEHQTGLAVDVEANGLALSNFAGSPAYDWLQSHAADYGFIQRYYKGYESITGYSAEEWHYRYVGVSVAKDMKSKNIKTLEQYWAISGGDY